MQKTTSRRRKRSSSGRINTFWYQALSIGPLYILHKFGILFDNNCLNYSLTTLFGLLGNGLISRSSVVLLLIVLNIKPRCKQDG